MTSTDEPGDGRLPMTPRAELRHWSTYRTVGEWFRAYHGYVPIQMAVALDQLMRRTGMTFPDAYRALLGVGKIIHIDPADDIEPPPDGADGAG